MFIWNPWLLMSDIGSCQNRWVLFDYLLWTANISQVYLATPPTQGLDQPTLRRCCSGCPHTIYHLSAPSGSSVNDFIDPSTYTLSYCSIDEAYSMVNSLGTGTLLSKIYLKNAFRLIPVRQQDWNLLGICWRGKYYIDTCLPFGLRSAPCIFNRLASAIRWILHNNHKVEYLLHYLDDFLTAGPPNTPGTLKQCYLSAIKLMHPSKQRSLFFPPQELHFWALLLIQWP